MKDAYGRRQCYYIDHAQDPTQHGGYVPSLVTENDPGHQPLTGDRSKFQSPWVWGKTLEMAEQVCAEQNANLGYTPEEAQEIVHSSIAASIRQRK